MPESLLHHLILFFQRRILYENQTKKIQIFKGEATDVMSKFEDMGG